MKFKICPTCKKKLELSNEYMSWQLFCADNSCGFELTMDTKDSLLAFFNKSAAEEKTCKNCKHRQLDDCCQVLKKILNVYIEVYPEVSTNNFEVEDIEPPYNFSCNQWERK